jgi:HEPN domain-containing protein
LSQLVAWRIRRGLGEQDRASRIAQLARQEVESLNQARELFDGGHYDLSVVEAWRALEARLRQVLLSRRIEAKAGGAEAVIHAAVRKGILKEPALGVVAALKRHWTVAVSTEPLSREAAVESLSAVRHVLSVTPVKEPAQVPGSGSGVVFEKTLVNA